MNAQQNSIQMQMSPQAGLSKWRLWGGGRWGVGDFFSLATNSSPRLKVNICILDLSVLFPTTY